MSRIASETPLDGRLPSSHRRWRGLQALTVSCGVLAALWVTTKWDRDSAPNVTVQRVIDGDTLVLRDGTHVRLIGVDTPERGDCGYQEATQALTRLAGPGTRVHLQPGKDPVDRYGRTLAYLTVDGRDLSTQLAREGWAVELTIGPNTAIRDQVQHAVADAQEHHRGNWGSCP